MGCAHVSEIERLPLAERAVAYDREIERLRTELEGGEVHPDGRVPDGRA